MNKRDMVYYGVGGFMDLTMGLTTGHNRARGGGLTPFSYSFFSYLFSLLG